ncbi:sigma-70 family RNA polymerase sigma factor [Actinoplanes sp. KI2]|uniref:RNA polymerase sigma factor n=1 Tax=Actinoplanes sp. KI2 TaxID=2983315 RepID=UPI0021D5AB6A|nr:sigma-70 family RNA polymerase sigma factor [Actinoplanes sp. KI2]MCU7727507.1 sigma-70 family RNA polymerase sigma factor [Actinoplanes sp. KI2]
MLGLVGKFEVRLENVVVDDGELVAAARGGEPAALGLLLERHRAAMRAVAVSLLGWGPDAEDAVQDAMLVAVRRIGDLRDPAAAGPWLRAVTRNECRARLRRHREVGWGDLDALPARSASPEQTIEENALRDWVWSAIDSLSEPLQVAVLLRYFTEAHSYEQIAAACDVPVGTVRSRLHEARRRLTGRLLAERPAADSAAWAARRRREAEDLLAAAPRGGFRRALAALAVPDLRLIGPQGQEAYGHDLLVHIMESDLRAGVSQRLTAVTAGRRVTILECDLHSPPGDPGHCPPGVLWLMRMSGSGIEQIRLFHPQPHTEPA